MTDTEKRLQEIEARAKAVLEVDSWHTDPDAQDMAREDIPWLLAKVRELEQRCRPGEHHWLGQYLPSDVLQTWCKRCGMAAP